MSLHKSLAVDGANCFKTLRPPSPIIRSYDVLEQSRPYYCTHLLRYVSVVKPAITTPDRSL
jgi:hypothetical protein